MSKTKPPLTKTRLLIPTAILLLASLALAQAPRNVAANILDNLRAEEVACQANELLGDMAEGFDEAYCGMVWDTLTDLNRDLTDDAYRRTGYTPVYPEWEVEYMDAGEMHMRAQSNGTYVSITGLLTAYDYEATVVIVTFDRIE